MSDGSLIVRESDKFPSARTGIAIIGRGSKGLVEFKNGRGLTLSERMFGSYKSFVEVDVSERAFTAQTRVSTAKTTLFFDCDVHVKYRVTDPIALIENAIRDGKAKIWPELEKKLSRATRTADVLNVSAAEDQADAQAEIYRAELERSKCGLKITFLQISLQVDKGAAELVRDVDVHRLREDNVRSKIGIEALEREAKLGILDGGPRQLLAELMRQNPANAFTFLQQAAESDRERYQNDLNLMTELLKTDGIESFEIPKEVKADFIERVMRHATNGNLMALSKLQPRPEPAAIKQDPPAKAG